MTQSKARSRCVALTGAVLALSVLLPDPSVGQVAGVSRTASFTLPNGLRVVHSPDRGVPLVALSLWYPTGGATEGPGEEGFALLMQRLHLAGEDFGWADPLGGVEYAVVDAGWTAYDVVVPAERLREGLMRQARRLERARLPAAEVREAIREVWAGTRAGEDPELPPFLRIRETLHRLLLGSEAQRAPFSFPRGSPPEVEAVQAFRTRHYGPESAVLVVTGDVDEKDLRRLSDGVLGSVPKGAGPDAGGPARGREEPQTAPEALGTVRGEPQTGRGADREADLVDGRLDRAVVELAYAAPLNGEPERVVEVLVRLLAMRSAESAAPRRPLSRVDVRRIPYSDLDVVVLTGIGEAGADPREVEGGLLALVAEVREGDFTPEEVREAWRDLALEHAGAAATVRGRAALVREGMLLHGDGERALRSALRPEAVEPGSVADAALRLLVPEHRFVVRLRPGAGGGG